MCLFDCAFVNPALSLCPLATTDRELRYVLYIAQSPEHVAFHMRVPSCPVLENLVASHDL